MRAGFILFTQQGERVPFFTEPTPGWEGTTVRTAKHGWKTVRSWMPGFFVRRVGKHYRVGVIQNPHPGSIQGSVYQLRAWDWQPPEVRCFAIRFPNVASVEMYLRHRYGQSG